MHVVTPIVCNRQHMRRRSWSNKHIQNSSVFTAVIGRNGGRRKRSASCADQSHRTATTTTTSIKHRNRKPRRRNEVRDVTARTEAQTRAEKKWKGNWWKFRLKTRNLGQLWNIHQVFDSDKRELLMIFIVEKNVTNMATKNRTSNTWRKLSERNKVL